MIDILGYEVQIAKKGDDVGCTYDREWQAQFPNAL